MVICPVDSIITEQRISHLSAYSRSGTQLYSSGHAASSTVEFNVLTGYDLYLVEQFNDLLRPPVEYIFTNLYLTGLSTRLNLYLHHPLLSHNLE